MSEKNRIFIVAGIMAVAMILFVATAIRAFVFSPRETTVENIVLDTNHTFSESASGLPDRLVIPSIKVSAPIEYVGIAKSGNMAVPFSYKNVGWYRYGPKPGEQGSAVIAGHLDNGIAQPAVFNELGRLKRGDEVYIETKNGEEIGFEVVEVRSYHYENIPKELLFNRNDTAYLNLITCAGEWLSQKSTYEERLVVFTERI
jgi:LPXTG-site transpeptidase (sortase) family protein